MSKEEILNILKRLCGIFDRQQEKTDGDYCEFVGIEEIDAIKGLLNLYNKEKEENRIMKAEFERLENIEDDTAQLKLLLKKEKEKNEKLLDEAMVTYFDDEEIKKSIANYIEKLLKENIQKDYISKNKIKEKIKELENQKDLYFEKQIIQGKIDLLKELLEE